MEHCSHTIESPISICKVRCEVIHAGRADDKNKNDNSMINLLSSLLY
jgi:hypothetical protein